MPSIPRFLSREIGPIPSTIHLDPEESVHCVRVLRLSAGDPICLIDGKGTCAEAVILKADPKATLVSLSRKEFSEPRSNLELVFGVTKPPALESIFRKCTELGVRSFQPLFTEHSVRLGGWNEERWNKIIMEACKQCQDPWIPTLKNPLKFEDWMNLRSLSAPLVFCDENYRAPQKSIPLNGNAHILVGPEGGWSDREREWVTAQDAFPLSLGPNRLRAETACLVALTLIKSKINEL